MFYIHLGLNGLIIGFHFVAIQHLANEQMKILHFTNRRKSPLCCCLINIYVLCKRKNKKNQLTETQRQIKDAEPNVQPEEKDHIGYFAKQEQVAHVLLHCDWERRKRGTTNSAVKGNKEPLHC